MPNHAGVLMSDHVKAMKRMSLPWPACFGARSESNTARGAQLVKTAACETKVGTPV